MRSDVLRALTLGTGLLCTATLFKFAAPTTASVAERTVGTVEMVGIVTDARIAEISGIAPSRRRDDVLWVHNDSGNSAFLFALSTTGSVLATYAVEGVRNIDWEDLASFELDGKPWLLIGDIGDNGGLRDSIELILVQEPDLALTDRRSIRPEWVLSARWPDGPRDAESLAVDPDPRMIYLLTKRRVPTQIFATPLEPPTAPDEIRTLRQIGTVPGIPQPTRAEIAQNPSVGRWFGQPTSMDRRADGSFVILTYRDAYLFLAEPGDDVAAILRRIPRRLGLPSLPQPEAVAFARDGRSIYATTERIPAPIVRVDSIEDPGVDRTIGARATSHPRDDLKTGPPR